MRGILYLAEPVSFFGGNLAQGLYDVPNIRKGDHHVYTKS
jgi:hypothetical protein